MIFCGPPLRRTTTKAEAADISADEIFVSDGAKCDCSNIQEIFGQDNRIAVCDPVYPVLCGFQRNGGKSRGVDPGKKKCFPM